MQIVRGAGFWLLAWVASAVMWLVLTDSVRIEELLAGAVVATLAATAVEVVRRRRGAAQSLRPGLALRAPLVLLRAVPDVGRLTRAAFAQLVRREPVRGRIVAMPFGHVDDDPDARALRAITVGFGSIAPNTIIVGVDTDTGLLIAHQLEPTGNTADLDPMGLA